MRESKVDYKFLEPLGITLERYMSLEDLDGEEWKALPGYEQYYNVSTLGRIKVLDGLRCSKYQRNIKTHILKPKTNGYKYWTVGLCVNNKVVYKYVHRLVAYTYLENPYNKPEVDHLNTNTNDNRLRNLQWVTHQENQCNPLTIFKNQLRGDNNYRPIVQLSVIGEKIAEWNNVKEAAFFTGINDVSISSNILHPSKYISTGGYIFITKEDYENGKFELPLLNSSSFVMRTGIPSSLTVVLYLRGKISNVYASCGEAAKIFSLSSSTIKSMCENCVKGLYKSNEIQFRFFKDLSMEDQMIIRKMLINLRTHTK